METTPTSAKTPQERYQAKPFLGSSHLWLFSRLNDISKDAQILDVGPGSGIAGRYLKEHLGVTNLDAVEIDAEARKHVTGIYANVYDSLEPCLSKSYDAILLMDVLEHMTDPFSYLEEISKLLSPDGRIYISVPNIAHWSIRLSLLFGFFEYTPRGILDETHYQFFNRKRFHKLLQKAANSKPQELNASLEPAEFVLPSWIWRNSAWEHIGKLRLFLARKLPGFFAYQHLAELIRQT